MRKISEEQKRYRSINAYVVLFVFSHFRSFFVCLRIVSYPLANRFLAYAICSVILIRTIQHIVLYY